jgi:CBS domain-containing protein
VSTIRDLLAKKGVEVAKISPDATALDAADLMNERRIGALCVVEGDTLVGVFTERDLLNRVVSAKLDPASTKIADVMTSQVSTCGPEGKTDDCATLMSQKHIRHLPVVEGGKLVGIVSTGDLMALQLVERQTLIEALHQYLYGRSR